VAAPGLGSLGLLELLKDVKNPLVGR
jgi:hypothetical protein